MVLKHSLDLCYFEHGECPTTKQGLLVLFVGTSNPEPSIARPKNGAKVLLGSGAIRFRIRATGWRTRSNHSALMARRAAPVTTRIS